MTVIQVLLAWLDTTPTSASFVRLHTCIAVGTRNVTVVSQRLSGARWKSHLAVHKLNFRWTRYDVKVTIYIPICDIYSGRLLLSYTTDLILTFLRRVPINKWDYKSEDCFS